VPRLVRRARQGSAGFRLGAESGAATVDFVLVGGLLTVIFVSIIQLALVLHVRNTLVDAAASGARYGTLADRSAADAQQRTASLIAGSLNPSFAQDVAVGESEHQGLRTLQVTVRAPFPVLGLLGPAGMMEVSGHAALAR
jgi:Flp pilus assembly protein TadG